MVIHEDSMVDGIPLSQFAPKQCASESLPTLFLYHGWDSAKDQYKELYLIRVFDPIRKIADLPHRPILLQHGTSDCIVPIDGQRKFYKELRKVYEGKSINLVEFQEIPRTNHYISLGMFEYAYKWIKGQLNG
ncbi:alpha/beta hydrolase [Alicyclobacillus sp. SO9]|nr:alpha/beta hydrolase [Alicyclobacillus sp. SO9]